MSIKDIVVHINDAQEVDANLAIAVGLAESQDAHLIGLHIRPPVYVPAHYADYIPVDVIEAQERVSADVAEQIKNKFESKLAKTDLNFEWRCEVGYPLNLLRRHARYSDLVIIGQGNSENNFHDDLAGNLALTSGRPVLVVPALGTFDGSFKNILVGWDASPYAARAIQDALPFLKRADRVEVLSINPEEADGEHGDLASADITHHLARHGVKAEAQVINTKVKEPGDMLLARVKDEGANLLVMGAYGHSKVREFVFGGVTKKVSEKMMRPVLLAH